MHIHGGDIYTYQGMLDFSANINPLGLPPAVVRAAAEGAAQAAAYPDTQCRDLRQALAEAEVAATGQHHLRQRRGGSHLYAGLGKQTPAGSAAGPQFSRI